MRWMALVGLVACSPPPEPLETFRVFGGGRGGSAAGLVSVTGADRDWTLAVAPAGGDPVTVEVHSPIRTDPSGLDGRTVSLDLPYDLGTELAIEDDLGPVWIANSVEAAASAGLTVAYGSPSGGEQRDGHAFRHYAVRFGGDDEEIELLAGETAPIVAGGVRWRVGVIGAWEVRRGPFERSMCGPADLLSFEMFRSDSDVEPTIETRPVGEPRVGSGCDTF